jgi:replicative DNA helicase Mcm
MTQHNTRQQWLSVLTAVAKDDIADMAVEYPTRSWVDVEYMDIYRTDHELAEALLASPGEHLDAMSMAVGDMSLPADVNITDAEVRVVGLPDDEVYTPGELTAEHTGRYIGVRGMLDRVTTKDEKPTLLTFECQRCGTPIRIPQMSMDNIDEPVECHGCERKGPFVIRDEESEFSDYCKVRVDHPPDNDVVSGEYLDGHVIGDLVNDHGEFGLISRAGEHAIVYGIVQRTQKDKSVLFERSMDVRAVSFTSDENSVDVDAHKDEFMELAARDDAVDLMAQSIVPELFATNAWEAALEWSVAYLFGAPRIDIPNGPTYRGDIHGAIISDFGMGKSMFATALTNYAPKITKKSATGLSSDVGLTAAAVQDDFGEGQWSIRPGILVKSNGGHVILDEIDKGPEDLSQINDAIEGEQMVDVDKAGVSASYPSRVGLLILGNPRDARFVPSEPVAPQIGVDQSTLSRMDGIITMRDAVDEETDASIAEQSLSALSEAQSVQYGDEVESEVLDRPVSPEVGKAWIAFARDNVHPRLTPEVIPKIRDWYAQEVRMLNSRGPTLMADEPDMPVPASPRVVMWIARFALAFARCHLRNEVTEADVDRALELGRRLISQNWNGSRFEIQEVKVIGIVGRVAEELSTDEARYPSAIAKSLRVDEDRVRDALRQLAQRGEAFEQNGMFKST